MTRQFPRLTRSLALAAVAVLAVTGCTARTSVDLTVRSAQSADVVVSADFTDEAAAVLHEQPAILDELIETFRSRTGAAPQVTSSAERVRVRADVAYEDLADAGTVTGIGEIRLTGSERDVQAAVELRDAPDLSEAVRAATETQPDAGAVFATMAKGTQLVVTITFPGGLDGEPQLVGIPAASAESSRTAVTIIRSLADAGPGAVVVKGDPTTPPPWAWIGGGSLIVLLGVAVFIAHRRDTADPRTAGRV